MPGLLNINFQEPKAGLLKKGGGGLKKMFFFAWTPVFLQLRITAAPTTPLQPLLRLSMHGLEHATADVSKIEDNDIREFAENAQSLLKINLSIFCTYMLMLFVAGRQLLSRLSV